MRFFFVLFFCLFIFGSSSRANRIEFVHCGSLDLIAGTFFSSPVFDYKLYILMRLCSLFFVLNNVNMIVIVFVPGKHLRKVFWLISLIWRPVDNYIVISTTFLSHFVFKQT